MYRREKSCHVEGWDSCGPATIPTILNRDFFKGLPWCVRICSLFVSLTCCGVRERVFFNVLLLIPDQKKTTLVFSMFLTQYSIFYLALCAPHSPLTLLSCCKIVSIFSKVEWLYRMATYGATLAILTCFGQFFISKVRAHVNMQLLTPNDALR
jgi:hypothetical protein